MNTPTLRLALLFVLSTCHLLSLSATAQDNEAPVAQFTVAADSVGTTQTYFVVDASVSMDDSTSTEFLEVRWDWESDGEFDTNFSTAKIDTIRYDVDGLFEITLQVRDAEGDVGTITRTVDVAFERDEGALPTLSHVPYEFDFLFTDLIFDPTQPIAYGLNREHRKLYIIDLQTGLLKKEYAFGNDPVALALTPDGTRLFIALHTRAETPRGSTGNIVQFDIDEQVTIGGFRVDGRPEDIVVTDSGILFSLVSNDLLSYVVEDETFVDSELVGAMQYIQLAPDQSHVYLTGRSSSAGIRHVVHDEGTFVDNWIAREFSPIPSNSMFEDIFLNPFGDRLITQAGHQFTTSEEESSDLEYLGVFVEGNALNTVLFNTTNNAIYTTNLYDAKVDVYSMTDDSWLGTLRSAFRVHRLGVVGDSLYVYREWPNNPKSFFEKHYDPSGDPPNTPPSAQLAIDPGMGTTLRPVQFNASASTDIETPDILQAAWDWESDGDIDLGFSSNLIIDHTFTLPGTYEVSLIVRDYFGMTDTTRSTVTIQFEEDPGAAPDSLNEAFQFGNDFTDLVFDPVRRYAYVSDINQKKIRTINLETGLVDKVFEFEFMPESLYMMPDGSKMYAALLTKPHRTYTDGEHTGVIVEFDLNRQVKTNQYLINEDPSDLFVTQEGHLFVMSGSGRNSFVRSYQAGTGVLVDSLEGVAGRSNMVLHPDEDRFYITTSFDAERVSIEGGKMVARWEPPEENDPKFLGRVFASPQDSILITSRGNIFSSSDEEGSDMLFIGALDRDSYNDIVFDTFNDVILALGSEVLEVYRAQDRELIHTEVLPKTALFVGDYQSDLYVISSENISLRRLQRYPHASLGALPIDRTSPNIPEHSALEQNFPNPFSGSTQIQLAVADSGPVSLKVYNTAGQEVATIQDGFLHAGYYTVSFSGENLSSGVYFARMSAANGFQEVINLILIR